MDENTGTDMNGNMREIIPSLRDVSTGLGPSGSGSKGYIEVYTIWGSQFSKSNLRSRKLGIFIRKLKGCDSVL